MKNKEEFLQYYWQQKPLLIRESMSDLNGIVDGGDLSGLSCEPEVEARIISGFGLNDAWSCRHGPFSENDFSSLPNKNWTLLVQGVDQWIEEVGHILTRFEFLPQWRLEDIMASYAPVGGGVGPHFDYYDVFLIQISGGREWKLGQLCNESTPLQSNDQVKLLSEFSAIETYVLNPGDMIYIPAGVAHWGTAISDDCITLSVGFRAPSEKELLTATLEHWIENLSENKRYRDSQSSIDKHPAKINRAAHKQLEYFLSGLTTEKLQISIQQAFGELVTEPRYSALDDEGISWDIGQLQTLVQKEKTLTFYKPPHSRLAFSAANLFVNGETYVVDEAFARSVCDGVVSSPLSQEQLNILVDCLNNGDIQLSNSDD